VTPKTPGARFWIALAVFQVCFGLVVFALTRNYYLPDVSRLDPAAARILESLPAWPDTVAGMGGLPPVTPLSPPLDSTDPSEVSRQADTFFGNQQYDQAATAYQQLLALDPGNADVLNNLGLTLHYVGRSAEALQRLDEAVTRDPAHQRSWLTLGFVHSRLGNTEQARAALLKASQVGIDEQIRQSARTMLDELPPGP
jgi:Flp pilus assembly protein TadD